MKQSFRGHLREKWRRWHHSLLRVVSLHLHHLLVIHCVHILEILLVIRKLWGLLVWPRISHSIFLESSKISMMFFSGPLPIVWSFIKTLPSMLIISVIFLKRLFWYLFGSIFFRTWHIFLKLNISFIVSALDIFFCEGFTTFCIIHIDPQKLSVHFLFKWLNCIKWLINSA